MTSITILLKLSIIFMPIISEHQAAIKEVTQANDLKKVIHHSHCQKNSIISIYDSRAPSASKIFQQPMIKGSNHEVIFMISEYIDIHGKPIKINKNFIVPYSIINWCQSVVRSGRNL